MDMSHRFYLRLLLISILSNFACSNHIVHVPSQKVSYHGSTVGSIEHFQGIKYARDTSGERRFTPPQPYIPKEDTVVDASQAGSICPQIEAGIPLLFDETPDMSEDCLNLRIARPAGVSPDSNLPVLVWIHGGGVAKGSAYDSHFNPDNLLRLSTADDTPVIYASINYRLTIFGFPRLPLLKDQKSLNLGVRDQRLGLEWTQENIHAFGGDPKRITVYGLSAGGTFSSLHTMAYGGEHGVPFQQAWMMSGPPGTALNMTSDATTAHTINVAEKLNCGGSTDLDTLKCLRALSMEELLEATMAYARDNHPPLGLFTFIPSVDNDFFPDRPSKLVQEGRFVKGIKMVYGWTQDDGAFTVPDPRAVQSEEDMVDPIRGFASSLSKEQLLNLFALYPATAFQQELENYETHKGPMDSNVSVHFFRVSRIMRDLLFTCSSIEFGYQMVKQTQQTQPEFDSVRLYDLNQSIYTPMLAATGMPYVNVMHGSDTPYLFNGYPEGDFEESDQELATQLSRSLIQFAYSGTPIFPAASAAKSFEWPAAFPNVVTRDSESVFPEFSMAVIGGPYGTGSVLAKDKVESLTESGSEMASQAILNNIPRFAGMGTASESSREQLIQAEDLHMRCAYLSSLDEALGR